METFDPLIARKIAERLEHQFMTFRRQFVSKIRKIRGAGTINEVMEAKKELMAAIEELIPLQDNVCYFCIFNKNICADCSYGKVHGKCGPSGSNSDWSTISKMQYDLFNYIMGKYWTGKEIK